jgi:ribosome-associated protein
MASPQSLSRSELKRRHKRLFSLVEELLALSDQHLKVLSIGEEFYQEIRQCRGLKKEARKRNIKYLAKMLQQEDVATLLTELARYQGSRLRQTQWEHHAKRLRDEIINEALVTREWAEQHDEQWEMSWPSETLSQLTNSYGDLDEKEIRSLAHQYGRSRNNRYYRELYRMILAAIKKQELSTQLGSERGDA